MDYLNPIEAVFGGGARGRVLRALFDNTSLQSLRQLAIAADVSPSQVREIIDDLVDLGMVKIQETPAAILVHIVSSNVANKVIQDLTDLKRSAINAMQEQARNWVKPTPLSLCVFGSFVSGQANRQSDIDVLAVHESNIDSDEKLKESWYHSLGQWVAEVERITGNPVNLIDLDIRELQEVFNDSNIPNWLHNAERNAINLIGKTIEELQALNV